ncbi:MAG: Cohesin domain protein [Candidatus Argoarchaeum ethanivorans]|uniref:Cohesin domain protein n=1 Tax=Candidatus Argoarchaeum ethanivorans TaxID=2608793 RepID=A0A811T7D6_9EURY|nr:MAG: Cohesin domain protein [Candidatus Argoarchaeum ethanivorans]
MRKERRIGIVTAATLALLFLLALSAATAAGAATVKVDPATQSVTPGDEFSVSVIIEGVTDMGMDQAVLNFDPSVMQVSGIIEGEFLKSGGTTVPIEIRDNTTGRVTFAYALTTGSVSGSGTLATINFDTSPSAAEGVYNLKLTEVALANSIGDPIVVDEVSKGTVTVGGSAGSAPPTPGFSVIEVVVAIGILAVVFAIRRRKG